MRPTPGGEGTDRFTEFLLRLVPPDWRASVEEDLLEEATGRGAGRGWVAWQMLRIAFRLRIRRHRPLNREDIMEMTRLWSDARFALRGLSREPLFVLFVIGTFALGIGVNAAMFGVVDRLLIRGPEGVRDAAGLSRLFLSAQRPRRIEGIAAYGSTHQVALGAGTASPSVRMVSATADFFPLLGVRPALGRGHWVRLLAGAFRGRSADPRQTPGAGSGGLSDRGCRSARFHWSGPGPGGRMAADEPAGSADPAGSGLDTELERPVAQHRGPVAARRRP